MNELEYPGRDHFSIPEGLDADWDWALTGRYQEPEMLSGKSWDDAETLILHLIWCRLQTGGSPEALTSYESESSSHVPCYKLLLCWHKKRNNMFLSISFIFFFFYVQTKLSQL